MYSPETDRCYLLPIEAVGDRSLVHLRLRPTANNQQVAIKYAAHYELGAIAQLGERRAGSAKAGGSNPPSSTPADETPTVVGAHEFRNRFGWYMERAATGESIVITRRGKPHLRLAAARSGRPTTKNPSAGGLPRVQDGHHKGEGPPQLDS